MNKFKTYKIVFTTQQHIPSWGWTATDLKKFWNSIKKQTVFGKGYSSHVVDKEEGIVRHTVFKKYDYDPRQRDGGELDNEVEDWLEQVNGIAPHQFIELDELPYATPK